MAEERTIKQFIHIPKKLYSFTGTSHLSPIEKMWSMITFFLGTVSLLLVILVAEQPRQSIQKLVTPIVESLQLFSKSFDVKKNYESFSFIPGWTYSKYDDIAMEQLQTLAFFDLPVNPDGTIDEENAGYTNFHSEPAANLFSSAHAQGKKVVVTVSQTSNTQIEQFLSDSGAQDRLIESIIQSVSGAGIDGVAVDFEYSGTAGESYRQPFNDFIAKLTERLHANIPNGQVNVVLSSTLAQNPFYDTPSLSKNADRIFVMAYDLAVAEAKDNNAQSPIYGYQEQAYWDDVSNSLKEIAKQIPDEKLVVERAWYGNGDRYPFYQSSGERPGGRGTAGFNNTIHTPLDNATIEGLVSEVPSSARDAARKNLPLIAKALEDEGILTPNVLAYALATIEHETAGTFEPIEEFKGRKSARRLGYEGGTDYFGRGFIQLTHLRNYQAMGERVGLGESLVQNPELASQPEVAAKILAAFFVDNGIANLAYNGRFVAARVPINPDYQGTWIANLAWKYLYMIG